MSLGDYIDRLESLGNKVDQLDVPLRCLRCNLLNFIFFQSTGLAYRIQSFSFMTNTQPLDRKGDYGH